MYAKKKIDQDIRCTSRFLRRTRRHSRSTLGRTRRHSRTTLGRTRRHSRSTLGRTRRYSRSTLGRTRRHSRTTLRRRHRRRRRRRAARRRRHVRQRRRERLRRERGQRGPGDGQGGVRDGCDRRRRARPWATRREQLASRVPKLQRRQQQVLHVNRRANHEQPSARRHCRTR
ncbi:hypothetical protein DENSPDRAFT_263270 [Dentipellis sp. KUC8613]|nr:hypothetical protein DENSPDRAFT_263270 [Dentipellis sp. KUC8613]